MCYTHLQKSEHLKDAVHPPFVRDYDETVYGVNINSMIKCELTLTERQAKTYSKVVFIFLYAFNIIELLISIFILMYCFGFICPILDAVVACQIC